MNVVFFRLGDSPASEFYVPLWGGNCKSRDTQAPGNRPKEIKQYSDTSANEDNSFGNHIR